MPAARRRTRTALAASATLALLTACAADMQGTDRERPEGADATTFGHVHGLGSDPADDSLYAATHFGVFDLGRAGAGPAERIADRWQDTMAFTVVGPHHFLASGHPDQRERLPVHLGLIESTDAGSTWEPISLLGEADFHALEAAGEWLYGYDSVSSELVVTEDRKEWRTLDQVRAFDLAADPGDPARVLATTAEGLVVYPAGGGSGRAIEGAPPLMLVDWPSDDLLVGVRRWDRLSQPRCRRVVAERSGTAGRPPGASYRPKRLVHRHQRWAVPLLRPGPHMAAALPYLTAGSRPSRHVGSARWQDVASPASPRWGTSLEKEC